MCNLRILKKSGSAFPLDFTGVSRYNFSVMQEVFPYMEQSMDLPQGYQIRPLTTDDLDQYNALLRYAFQVTEQELFDTGWKDEEIKQSKCPCSSARTCWAVLTAKPSFHRLPSTP